MYPVLLFLSLVGVASSANILGVFPVTSYSHQIVYRTLMLELNRRGHNITVLTPNPVKDPNLRNYTEIDLSFFYETWNKKMVAKPKDLRIGLRFPELIFLPFVKLGEEMCHSYLSHPSVGNFIRQNEKYDLVIWEFGVLPCFYGFTKFSRQKHVGIFSFQASSVIHSILGNPTDASYIPEVYFPFFGKMSFYEKLRLLVYQGFMWGFYSYVVTTHEEIAKHYFGNDLPGLVEVEKNISALMVNTHFTMSAPRPMVPNIIEIGGPAFHMVRQKPKPLPKDLQEFMDDAPHGVIYFSLGTNVKTNNMPTREEEELLKAFRKLKQKIVWKWENENLKVNLDNVYKGKWFPQIDVLAHPNVKGFVTQGGLQSIGEAIHFKVPMVVMPFFADQGHNAKRMETAGVAIVLDVDYLNADTFTKALNQIMYNKTYKENMMKFSELVKDQPMPPLEKAVWWTEYVIRHEGASHLRSAAATMPWYQYFLLDVLAFLFAAVFIILYITYRICKCLARLAFPSKTKKD